MFQWLIDRLNTSINNEREVLIKNAVMEFKTEYPQYFSNDFEKRLIKPLKRVSLFTIDSIVGDRFIRAGATFCGTFIPMEMTALMLYLTTPHAALTVFIAPFVSSLMTAILLIATARRSVSQRLKGEVRAFKIAYLDELTEKAVELKEEKKQENSYLAIIQELERTHQENAQQIARLTALFNEHYSVEIKCVPPISLVQTVSANDDEHVIPEVKLQISPR